MLVSLLVIILVVFLVIYLVGLLPIDQMPKNIIMIIVIVIAIITLLSFAGMLPRGLVGLSAGTLFT